MMLTRKRWLAASALVAVSALAAGCSSSGGGNSGGSGSGGHFTVAVGVEHAFTGQNSFFGLNAEAACKAAAQQVNGAGGILGHQLTCPVFDTKGDPADAVPVTNRMLVATGHLVMVLGPDGNDIPSVLPLLEKAGIPEINTVGDPRYDTQTSPDFWRLTPSDSTQAPALAYYAYSKGFKKVAEIFTSDLSAQTTTGPFKAAYTKMGGTIVKALTIAPDQSSYQTEVSQVLAAHPQAVVGEMDAQTAATFLSEMRQQHGSIIPVIMTQRATQGDWAPAVGPAIGQSSLAKYVTAIAPALSATGTAYDAYASAMKATKANPFAAHNSFVAAQYDGVIAFALAMEMAKSIDPSAYVKDIAKITAPSPGATVVGTFAEGVAALKAGKTIQFIGASGPMVFNQYNTADRPYAVWTFNPATSGWSMGQILPKDAGQH
ncbi:MAG TPA: ABC transporter substrate-binding protein [Streptosporangiaceae bacterium]